MLLSGLACEAQESSSDFFVPFADFCSEKNFSMCGLGSTRESTEITDEKERAAGTTNSTNQTNRDRRYLKKIGPVGPMFNDA
jgi:hypothetical protein